MPIMGLIPQMTNQQRLMVVIDSTPMCFYNSTSPWGEFSPSKTRPKSMSSTSYPMVDPTIKIESPQVYSNDHLPNPSVEFRDMFQCTRKSTNFLAIGTYSVSLQQLLISKSNSKSGLFHHSAGSTLVFILKAEKMK